MYFDYHHSPSPTFRAIGAEQNLKEEFTRPHSCGGKKAILIGYSIILIIFIEFSFISIHSLISD